MNRDLEREEIQVQKIRELKKERNRLRGETNRLHAKAPGPKRRKINTEDYEMMEEKMENEAIMRSNGEKRKSEEIQLDVD